MKKLKVLLVSFVLVFGVYAQVTYQLEIFGGYGFVNPADLNLSADYFEDWVNFYYDNQYNFLESVGIVSNLDVESEGEFPKIKSAIPLGGRFRVNFTESFAVALGVRYFSKTASSNPSFSYDMITFGLPIMASVDFTKFELMVKVLNPYLSFFYTIPEIADVGGTSLDFEVFAGAGYMMADIKGEISVKTRHENPFAWVELTWDNLQEGSGKGINFFGGARINVNFASNIGMFIEGNYDYIKIKKLTGKGSYTYTLTSSGGTSSTTTKEWEGDLFIVEYDTSTSWGDATFQYPTSDPDEITNKLRDFELNLSGFQFLFGFFFKF